MVPILVTVGQGHQATEAGQIITCPDDKVRTAHPIVTKLGRYFPFAMLPTWLHFGGILSKTFLTNLYVAFQMRFPNRTLYLPYLRNGWSNWCEIKSKWVKWMLRWLGYLSPWPLTLIFQGQFVSQERDFKVKYGICHISAKNGSIVKKQKSKHIDWMLGLKWDHRVRPCPWPWPWIFKVKYGICYK